MSKKKSKEKQETSYDRLRKAMDTKLIWAINKRKEFQTALNKVEGIIIVLKELSEAEEKVK